MTCRGWSRRPDPFCSAVPIAFSMQHVEVTDSIIAFQMFTLTGPKPSNPSPSHADTKVIGAMEQKESGSRGYVGLCPKYGGMYHII